MSCQELARDIVRRALEAGATDAECTISEGDEFSASVRMRELENLKEAGARGAGVRVMVGKRTGSAYTSDLTEAGLRQMVASAIELARITSQDPFAGLPEAEEFGSAGGDLQIFHDDVGELETGFKIEQAKAAESAALEFDPRITTSEGATFDSHIGGRWFANSRGFSGGYRTSSCSLSVIPVAKDGDAMERDYWFSAARSYARLERPEDIGREAARRTLRRLGARKVPTRKVPVVFEPRVARSLIDHLFEAVNGEAIYRKASFLTDKLAERIASGRLTMIDDGTMPGGFGTSPFDDEGVPSRRTVVIEGGVLASYLLNCYTARKLGLKTTGNASRGITGNASVGHGNLYAEPGSQAPEAIIASVRNGFYVTELMGFGVNIVTGDYSRGAVGLWIENGELAYPVHEVTISSTLGEMLRGVEAVGSDLEFRGSTAAPTILIGEMTVSGH
jgi:PmbA protein